MMGELSEFENGGGFCRSERTSNGRSGSISNTQRNASKFSSSPVKTKKEKLRTYLAKMASQTYIHGVKEVYHSKTLHERLFWSLVCFTCIGAAVYEIYQVFRLYNESGVATKISVENVDRMRYPTILFCPTTWLSEERVRALDVDPEVMNFTLSLLEPTGGTPRFQDIPSKTNELIARLHEIVSRTRSHSVAGLLKNLSLHSQLHCSCCDQTNIRQHVTLAGVCSVIDLCETAFQVVSIPSILYIVDKRLAADTLAPVAGGFISLYENYSQISISNHDPIFLTPNSPIRVKLSVTKIRRISTAEKPCQNLPKAKSVARCEFECIDSVKNHLCYNCSKYGFFSSNATRPQCGYGQSWQQANDGQDRKLCEQEDESIANQLLECKRKCVPPCNERIYTVGAVMAMARVKNEQTLSSDPQREYLQAEFLFTTFTETVFEDVNTFNFDKFISSIGGQTGLWCGASVVSLCQLISFFCCPCLHWTHLRYNSIRREAFNRSSIRRARGKKRKRWNVRSVSFDCERNAEERVKKNDIADGND